MAGVRDKLINMFVKVMAGTVTREEGTLLINALVKESPIEAIKELANLIETPPQGVFPKTILHTIALSRNKLLYNIMVACLEHRNEEVSILAAQELARLKTSDSRGVLYEHLNSEVYHVRKASAMAIAQEFGDEGIGHLKEHVREHREPFYRSTSAYALLGAGKKGMDAIMSLLNSGASGAISTSAEVLCKAGDQIGEADVPKIIEALMAAGDRKDTQAIVELLRVVASLRSRALVYEKFVQVFTDSTSEPVRDESKKTLDLIRSAY